MKSYACYPGIQNRRALAKSVNPYFNPAYTTNEINTTAVRPAAANILRKEAAYVIELAVPGLTKEQVRIELLQDQLIFSAARPESTDTLKYTRKEFDYAGFKRVFRLHPNADTDRLTATYHQGVLTVVIPDKTPETIKINIQ